MEELPKISIIITINKKNHINDCLQSLKCQTYSNLEFIFVNTMKSNIKRQLQKRFSSTFLYQHIALASNLTAKIEGYKKASGEYFVFLNSNNKICSDFCRKMITHTLNNNADICISDWILENNKLEKKYIPLEEIRNLDIKYSNTELVKKYFSEHGYDFSWYATCNKLFSKKVVSKFIEGIEEISKSVIDDEILFSSLAYIECSKIVNVHNIFCIIRSFDYYTKFSCDVLNRLKSSFVCFDYIKKYLGNKNKLSLYETDIDLWFNKILYRNYIKDKNTPANNFITEHSKDKTLLKNKCVSLPKVWANFGNEYEKYENIIKTILSDKTDIISFDIFDTLLVRKVFDPQDVFTMIACNKQAQITATPFLKFAELRTSAEENVRKNFEGGEVNIDDIYNYLCDTYGMDKTLAEELKIEELRLEYELSSARQTGKDLYDIAKLNNKTIIYTSDMYLHKDFIYKLLTKNGYSKQNEMFLSCEYKTTKHLGGLYKEVIKKYQNKNIIHIGDNVCSDIVSAKNNGITPFLLPNNKQLFNDQIISYINEKNQLMQDFSFIGLRSMFAISANKLLDFPFVHYNSPYQCSPAYVGYYALGMHLYALTDWIIKNSIGRNTLHFAARDGYLIMKAYEIFNEFKDSNLPKANYLLMSRKFLLPFILYDKKDLYTIISFLNIKNNNLEKLLNYFPASCINKKYYDKLAEEEKTEKYLNIDDFCKRMSELENSINFKELKKYQSAVKKYYLSIINKDDILVDIGYSGRVESVLTHILGFPLDGLYLHQYTDDLNFCMKTCGFTTKCFYEYKPKITGEPRELPFMKDTDSFVGYKINGENLSPVFDKKSNKNNEHVSALLNILQTNALQFIKDFISAFKNESNSVLFTKDTASLPWEIYLSKSSNFDREMFKSILFDDDISNGFTDVLNIWDYQIENANKKRSLIFRIGNKLLPKGTKRRKFAKKVACFIAPKDSKRRKFLKKFLKK